jgi:hypothetical protein
MAETATDSLDTGLAMEEYEEYGLDPAFKQRVQAAMDRWDNGVEDLAKAAKEMKQLAEEMPPHG